MSDDPPYLTDCLDGPWLHFGARPDEVAVRHPPTVTCPAEGRHPKSDCGYAGGRLKDTMELKR